MLPRENRLTAKSDFEYVRQNGNRISTPIFSVSYVKRDSIVSLQNDTLPRFGFIVSKKISTKAHIRNKAKRRLRETVKKNLNSVKPGFDYVIIAKPGIVHATHDTIEAQVKKALCS